MMSTLDSPPYPLVELAGYTVLETLSIGKRTAVYRAIAMSGGKLVILKTLQQQTAGFEDIIRLRNQYAITKDLDHPNIVTPTNLGWIGDRYILEMEDWGGVSLQDYCQYNALDLGEILEIGLQLSDALQALHQHCIIHKDIKPANILIRPETKQVKLIDFSIASLLPKETQEIQNPNVLEGTLAYLAPEQTGRMNRGIDYRADFYALGVTLYQLLGGTLPFTSDDPLELVHCHIARLPKPVNQVNAAVPEMVVAIVTKLMAKNAEDRYQSALGLKYDLHQCLQGWTSTGAIADFKLGERDLSDRFLIPEKLYGREAEVQTLLDAFDRVTTGASELMLVAGFSGIGKTAVVNEVHKPITRQQGYFIKGKFDQFNRNIPLSAFVQALRDLMEQLFSESDAQLAQWKTQILATVGENGQVLIEVIPELESIIGKQPPAPELSGTVAQNRFNLLFQKFIEVFTTAEHPLVLFLDDLQWADLASLQLLKLLMNDHGYLLILGACRDNEVSPTHPLMVTIEELKKTGAIINTITLAPLTFEDTSQLVADTLNCSTQLAKPLSELIDRKTQGNPFFTTQFLKALHEENHITFNSNRRYWECDIAQVNAIALTDDIVEFMALQLQKLPDETQQLLKLAACIGNQFDLETLAIVSERSPTDAATALWRALQEGLILPTNQVYKFFQDAELTDSQSSVNPKYRFLHDRIQQAAYSLISDDDKKATHYQIGQLLLQQISPEAREERIFELVNQLNYGTDLITQATEREELAQLNLMACHKAKSATAYQAGREYANTGLSLLGETAWQQYYDTTISFHNNAAELAMLCGDFKAMEQLIETVIVQTKTLLEQINVYQIKIQSNVSQNKLNEAIFIAIKILRQLGINFPETPTQSDIQQSLIESRNLVGNRDINDLVHLPIMADVGKIAILQIANSIIPAAYIAGSPLFPLLVALSVKLSLQHGNTSASVLAYASYGIISCNLLQDVDTGVKFGQLVIQLVSKLDTKAAKPEVFSVGGLFILHRKSHIRETLLFLQEGYLTALEVGNLEMAGYTAHGFCLNSFWCGQTLTTLEQKTRTYCNGLVQLNQLTAANWCRIYWQSNLNLLGEVEYPSILSGEAFQEEEFLTLLISVHDLLGLFIFYLYKLLLCYLFGDVESAKKSAIESRRYLMAGTGLFGEPVFYFYDSLAILGDLNAESSETLKILQQVEKNQIQLQQQWAHYAPMNHQHKVDLVEAEKCRVLGQKYEAGDRYDRAIAGAKENGYIQEEALANELAAKFYLDWGKEKVAAGYMQEAYYCYARWGAKAKTDDLESRYPQLLQPILQAAAQPLNVFETLASIGAPNLSLHRAAQPSRSSSTSINTVLDVAAILKASQSLAGTIQLDGLLHQLTQIILQNSGGDRCVLILPNEAGEWMVRAIATPDETQLCAEPLVDNPKLPIKLIQYVKNTQEVVAFDDLKTDLPVIDDDLRQRQPKSLLCLPILNQGRLIGILYLKNRSTSGVFTSDRRLVLNFLCTQAAISLENAQLYQQSQSYAEQLERSLTELKTSQARFSKLADNLPGVIYQFKTTTTGELQIVYFSPGSSEMFEVTPELAMKDALAIIGMVHPEDWVEFQRSIALSAASLKTWEWEGRFVLPSGTIKWIQGKSRPEKLPNGDILWDGLLLDVSDQKQLEIERQQTQAELVALFQAMQDVIVVLDADGRYQKIAPTGAHLLYRPAQSMLGKLLSDVLPADKANYFLRLTRQVLETQEMVQIDYNLTIENHEVWFEGSIVPLTDTSVVWFARDITDRKQLEAEQQRLIDILEATPDYIGIANHKGEVVWHNRPLRRLHPEITKQKHISECHPAWVNEIILNQGIPSAIAQGSWSGELALLDAQGGEIPVSQVLIVHKSNSGEVNYVSTIMRDISDRKAYEENLEKTNAELMRATRMKDEFLATMSHELRTPLNAILGMSESLQEEIFGAITPRQTEAITLIEKSGTHLLNLINDILDLSKITADQLQLELAPINLAHLCHDHLPMLQQQAQKKQIQIHTDIPGNLPTIQIDAKRISQVLINLLSNAIKFTPEGGAIYLSVAAQSCSNTLATAQPTLQITVQDTGIGIAPQDLDRIFQPFVQIDSALNRKYEGTGLGLALVKQIVERHGGHVHVLSRLGMGSTFTIDLPWTPTERASNSATSVPDKTISVPVSDGPLVLLVEDDDANVLTLSCYLKAKGFQLAIANNGQEAIDILATLKPQVILMDIQMPEMDGIQATQYIRQTLKLRDIPIIALTALAMQGDEERCFAAGANAYMSKPVKLKQLETLLNQYRVSM